MVRKFVLLIAVASLGVALVFAARANARSRWGADYFPNVTLTTQDGKQVRFYDDLLKGKIVAIDLIYTTCKYSCPLETARMRQVQKMLGDRVGKDIFFYSITIDPEHDTPEVLKDYSEMYNAGPGWLFLTGKKDDIDLISKKLGLYTDPNPKNKDGHTPSLLIGNEPAGQWMRNSATDNPKFLSIMIGNFIDGWRKRNVQEQKDYSQAPAIKIDHPGQYLFATRCAACHSIGEGDKVGPDLANITKVREREWLMRFIGDPDKLLAEKDATAVELFRKYKQKTMPNLRLADADIAALIDFMATQDQVPAAQANGSQR